MAAKTVSERIFGSLLAKGREIEQVIIHMAGYAPNQPEITPAGFDSLLDAIEIKNAEVNAKVAIAGAKIASRAALYSRKPEGILGRVGRIKAAIAAQFGRSSTEYTAAAKIKLG